MWLILQCLSKSIDYYSLLTSLIRKAADPEQVKFNHYSERVRLISDMLLVDAILLVEDVP